MTLKISLGLPRALRTEAARIYWQAFGVKLMRVLGPDDRAVAFLERALRSEFCMIAQSADGRLVGIVGFQTRSGAFAGGSVEDMRAIYGRAGAMWRMAVLRMLATEIREHKFMIDGICVIENARGLGVGSALIDAISVEAASRGYTAIQLDVVDENTRARALYDRLGFVPLGSQNIGILQYLFRFKTVTSMIKPLT